MIQKKRRESTQNSMATRKMIRPLANFGQGLKEKQDNGTPFTDEQWQNWYGHKSNKELFIEREERNQDEE